MSDVGRFKATLNELDDPGEYAAARSALDKMAAEGEEA